MRWDRAKLRTLLRYFAVAARRPRDAQAAGEQLLAVFRIVGSRVHPPEEDWVRDVAHRAFPDRTDFAAARRQAAAVRSAGDRRAELSRITAPTLVLTGEDDPVQPVRAGRATAEAIPGARFVTVPGMGHDLPRALWPTLVGHIDAVAGSGR
ncbi:alpha/beta fold hydrolase [Actinophytocola xanthii]|uniref:Peptidase S33 tripeptidyl aminopeptidase-like C-terminal domain-containing protein n=1 Tax=Actinophytocola xanthii TaxID=1912961 RepID=A0A1Q8CC02_9PSEU|nr:alpha/beta hydrolase [Actinophytocola xanthii]OLF11852.1 hypothetical protein BU204_29830 [Actinophytocola xanthii]